MSVDALKEITDRNQEKASRPDLSAWVSANAGSGKTTVLVRRVLRLLLHTDPATGLKTRPENILCLTYTKAAAGEMKNRLFKDLAGWAACSEAKLTAELEKLLARQPTGDEKKRARTLFAETLDARGGLKIYTIHAFCERLLHRFPLEANVPAGFRVLDEYTSGELLDAAVDVVLEEAARIDDPLHDPLMEVAAAVGDDQFRTLLGIVLGKREQLLELIRSRGGQDIYGEERTLLSALFGAPEDAVDSALLSEMAGLLDDDTIREAIAVLEEGSTRDLDRAADLSGALSADDEIVRIEALKSAFLTQKSKPRGDLMTKGLREDNSELNTALNEAKEKFYSLALARDALNIAGASAALLTLADAVFQGYEQHKRIRAALDYDDLIEKTGHLLYRSGAAAWVLYKLDYGIDHVLVDEAQDTSPAQWRVIRALTVEFFSGEAARNTQRTIFGVGDEKQSIYSFQGADPASFARMGGDFARLARGAEAHWESVPLTVSFRSSPAVLEAVDAVFAQQEAAKGVSFDGSPIVHEAVREGEPGLVEIWPTVAPDDVTPADPFLPHLEIQGAGNPVDRLASRIADKIAGWLNRDTPEILASQGRPIRPGDILILLRRRDPFARAMIRELKARNIPVAGADRMKLVEQIAVMDLMALTEFLLMPTDDLSLASVLKSPLISLDDDDLFALAHDRKGSLWQALRDKAAEAPRWTRACETLQRWLSQADMRAPYEFFAGLLEENGMAMRHRMIARLGADAADALDEFLNMALAYEQDAPVSLQGFLHFLASGEAQVKRDMEQARDEVRIMTVHGAKGLEAEIVFLPDTCGMPVEGRGGTVLDVPAAHAGSGMPDHIVWAPTGSMNHVAIVDAKAVRDAARHAEYNRLLYVAMTRAKDRLYVCGWETTRRRNEHCWYNLVRNGLEGLAQEITDETGEVILRFESGGGVTAEDKTPRGGGVVAAALPDWAVTEAAPEPSVALPVAPSAIRIEGGDTQEGLAEQPVRSPLDMMDESRFLRGKIIHGLLEHLPALEPEQREAAAIRFVGARGKGLSDAAARNLVAETLRILDDPVFAPLFGAESLAEVPLAALMERKSADLPPYEFSGQIDRIAIRDEKILIVDYKTNRPPPDRIEDVAPAYLAQLAVYRAGIRAIFGGKPVEAALLWTDTPKLMPVPESKLVEAEEKLRRAS